MTKREWRAHLRNLHEGREERDRQSAAMCRHILECDEYKSACVVGGYMPMVREADVLAVLTDALAQGKVLALPLCGQAPHMSLRRVDSLDELVPGAYGILEPKENTPIIPVSEVDVLLVPLEGIDREGIRLGKGGGYYDHLLSGGNVKTIGCALKWQWTEQLPADSWDKPLFACADEDGVHVICNK